MATNKKTVKKSPIKKDNIFDRKLKEKNKSSKKSDIDFDNLEWIKEDTGSTWDFDTHPEFIGKYLRSEQRGGKGKDKTGKKKEEFTVNIFLSKDGSEVALPNNYAIKSAIEKHGEAFYKITFTQMKKMAQGRKVRVFEIFTA